MTKQKMYWIMTVMTPVARASFECSGIQLEENFKKLKVPGEFHIELKGANGFLYSSIRKDIVFATVKLMGSKEAKAMGVFIQNDK